MRRGRRVPTALVLAAALGTAACGERAAPGQNTGSAEVETAQAAPAAQATPVRVGEAGPAFRACQAAGTPRNLDAQAGETLPVRAAPFDDAAVDGRIAAAARFFVCSRSIDQRWLGVVFSDAGTLDHACGVAAPVPARRNYEGPCKSGWVESAAVRLVAG